MSKKIILTTMGIVFVLCAAAQVVAVSKPSEHHVIQSIKHSFHV